MADTMTLEQVRDRLQLYTDYRSTGGHEGKHLSPADLETCADAIDAAIKQRDRLRGDVSGMTEELLHVPSREEWRELQKRAERAEAELAALKARIAMTPACDVFTDAKVYCCVPRDWVGKRVRLLVEECECCGSEG